MKKSLLSFALFFVLMTGCFTSSTSSDGGDDDDTCTDPTGMVTTYLEKATITGGDPVNNAFNFHTGNTYDMNCLTNYDKCDVWFNGSSLNFWSHIAWANNNTTDGWIADAGSMTGLGCVTSIPTSGFTTAAAATLNHGYVMKLYDGTYVRFFFDQWMTSSITGGVTGARIKWQWPFRPATQYLLTVIPQVNGRVTSGSWGIDCRDGGIERCTYYYDANTVVTLTETPTTPHNFTGWTGDCTGGAQTCTLTMNANKTVTATFSQ